MQGTVEKNPLISIYKSFSKSDVRRLTKWLDSPAHNLRDDVRVLHAYLTGGQDRLYKTSSLTKMRLWKRLFPEEPFDDARLRQTFHWALKATEEFLAFEQWQSSPFNKQLALVAELRKRNIGDVWTRSLKKTMQLQEKVPLRNEEFFRNEYRLELEREEHRYLYQPLKSPRLQETSASLDLTYFIEKLKISGNMIFQQRVYKETYDLKLVEEVVKEVKALDLSKYPVLAIHYYGYLGLVKDDISGETISLLRRSIEEHGDVLSRPDLRHVILMAINLCISNMNQGREPYIRESFEWYKIGFAKDVIAENNLLTRATYLNVITIVLRLQEYEWARQFIENYTHQLEEDVRGNTERFARARLAYGQKDYDTSMPLLVQVDFKHPVYNLMAKTLLLKIYFELDEFDALDSQLDSMTTYIRRKQLSDLHKNNFNNIVRYTRQLSRMTPGDRDKLVSLRERVETASPLTEKKWLLERLEEK